MRASLWVLCGLAGLHIAACASAAATPPGAPALAPAAAAAPAPANDAAAIEAVLAAQAEAWNRGDLKGYMAGYWNDPALRFASGGEVTMGWAETLARYEANYDTPEKRGTLAFHDLDVRPLAPDAAVVFGRWKLTLADGARPRGLFTLLFRKVDGAWVIVADHTSTE